MYNRSFLGQVPIAITCCLFLAYSLRSSLRDLRDLHKYGEEGEDYHKPHTLNFDYPGAITLAVWISSFLAVIDLQEQLSWGDPLVLSITIVGLLSLVAFLALETYPGNRELLIPLRLFKTGVGAFCVAQVCCAPSYTKCSLNIVAKNDRSNSPPFETENTRANRGMFFSC